MNKLIKEKFVDDELSMDVNISLEDNTIWLSLKEICTLFDRSKATISKHLKDILHEQNNSVVSVVSQNTLKSPIYETTGPDGKTYKVKYYNLEIINEIGKKVSSNRGELLQQFYDDYKRKMKPTNDINNKVIPYHHDSINIDVIVSSEEKTIWLNQEQIAMLFETTQANVSMHINNILSDQELDVSVYKDFLYTAPDGKRYKVVFYNLDMILAIGFRVRTKRAVEFRKWAYEVLGQYLMYGYVADDDRLNNLEAHVYALDGQVRSVIQEIRYIKDKTFFEADKELIFASGQFFDAREYIQGLLNKAKKCIDIIDPYFDSVGLTYLENLNTEINKNVYISDHAKLTKEDINAFSNQYGSLSIYTLNTTHDRFIIIDEKECYLVGASLNRLGNKLFAIVKLDNEKTISTVIEDIKAIKSGL